MPFDPAAFLSLLYVLQSLPLMFHFQSDTLAHCLFRNTGMKTSVSAVSAPFPARDLNSPKVPFRTPLSTDPISAELEASLKKIVFMPVGS